MPTLTITLSEERWTQLQEKAERYRVPVESLIRASLEDLLTRSNDEELQRTMRYVLTKHADLYRRLAKAQE